MLCFPEICITLKVHTSNHAIVINMTSNILWTENTVYMRKAKRGCLRTVEILGLLRNTTKCRCVHPP